MRRNKRNRYSEKSPVWTWVSFIAFGLIITLLGTSLIQKISPAQVLRNLFTPSESLEGASFSKLKKKELIILLEKQDSTIQMLKAELDDCRHDDGYNKAYIATQSESLNMRSEPSLNSTVLMKIPNKSRVSILFYDDVEYFLEGANGKWCRILYGETEGWVWGNYLDIPE